MRRRLRSAYLSTVLSISLVLLLVGVASLLLVNARGVSDYFKEHMQISVLMKPDISDAQTLEYQVELDAMDFVLSTEFISKAQGTREMEQMLGEGFLDIFEASPIPASVNVRLKAGYVSPDSLDLVKAGNPKSVASEIFLARARGVRFNNISFSIEGFRGDVLFLALPRLHEFDDAVEPHHDFVNPAHAAPPFPDVPLSFTNTTANSATANHIASSNNLFIFVFPS